MGGHRVWTTGGAWLYVYEWLRAHPAERDNRVWTGWGRNIAPLYCPHRSPFSVETVTATPGTIDAQAKWQELCSPQVVAWNPCYFIRAGCRL